MKGKADKLHVDKLEPVPVNLSKLINVVINDVVKKDLMMLRSKLKKIKYLILLT